MTLNLTFCPLFLTDRNAWAQVKRCQTCQWQQDRHRKGDPETSLQGPGYCRGGGEFPFHFSWTIMCRDDALSSFTLTHSFFTYLFLCHHMVLSPQRKKVPAQSHENIVKLWAWSLQVDHYERYYIVTLLLLCDLMLHRFTPVSYERDKH